MIKKVLAAAVLAISFAALPVAAHADDMMMHHHRHYHHRHHHYHHHHHRHCHKGKMCH